MAIFKNKFFLWLVFFSVSFYLLSAPVAQAGKGLGTILSVAVIVVAVVFAPYTLPGLMIFQGDMIVMGILFGGLVACAEGILCPGGSGGVILTQQVAGESNCTYQLPMTFYNPYMNETYYYSSECSAWETRATDDPKNPTTQVCVSNCFRDTNLNEADRQVAIYRFVLPSSVSQNTLNDWFINQIKVNVGLGFLDMSDGRYHNCARWQSIDPKACGEADYCGWNYYCGRCDPCKNCDYSLRITTEPQPLVKVPYSQMCSGNVCKFTDATAPNNSYVAYVAKILGPYSSYSNCAAGCNNKFFNTNNASSVTFPDDSPYVLTLGNAIIGPFRTDVASCPSSKFNLSVSKTGAGSGLITSSPAGINCGDACSVSFTKDSSVTLSALASENSVFSGWSGGECSGTGSCTVVTDKNRSVNAVFNKNRAPTATDLRVTQPDYGLPGYNNPAANFSWVFSDPDPGDSQSAYQVRVSAESDFSSLLPDFPDKVSSASNSYFSGLGKLAYNTVYYWRVKVWDSHNLESSWALGSSFATPKHAYPTADFSWSPHYPAINEEVQFTDKSEVYGGATKAAWLWTIPDATYVNSTEAFSQNPQVKFNSKEDKVVELKITDSDGYSSTASKTIKNRWYLPDWREISPKQDK
jgi:hypothetical protein